MNYHLTNMRCSGEVIPPIDREQAITQGLFAAIFSPVIYWFMLDVVFIFIRQADRYTNTVFLINAAPLAYAIPSIIGMVVDFTYISTFARSRRACLYITLACCIISFFLGGCVFVMLFEMTFGGRIYGQADLSIFIFILLIVTGIGFMIMIDRHKRGTLGMLIGSLTYLCILTVTTSALIFYQAFSQLNHYAVSDFLKSLEDISLGVLFLGSPAIAWISARLVEQLHVRRALRYGGV